MKEMGVLLNVIGLPVVWYPLASLLQTLRLMPGHWSANWAPVSGTMLEAIVQLTQTLTIKVRLR